MTTVAVLARKKEQAVGDQKKADKIRRLICQALALKKKMEAAQAKLIATNAALLPFAEDLRETTGLQTATFKVDEGQVVVKFAERIGYEEKDMPGIKAALGPVFAQAFHVVPSFAVLPESIPEIKKKLGADFEKLVLVQETYKHTDVLKAFVTDGDSEIGKKLRQYVTITPTKPAFSYEE
jgi:hypothetical protein